MFNKFVIYKKNLINNINQIKAKNPQTKICAMVKANAYGVGEQQVVKILNKYVDFFGVANYVEALKIKNLTNKKILITSALDITHINKRFSYTCNSLQDIESLANLNKKINIHLKINSGMNRFGISSIEEAKQCLQKIAESKLILEGVYTHFATTDEYVSVQLKTFHKYVALTQKMGFNPIFHADNSHVFDKFNHNFQMVRIGFNLYNSSGLNYKPVVEIKTQIVQTNIVKKGQLVGYDRRFVASSRRVVAVLPLGYADGFDMRYLGLKLNISGSLCKVLNICMDCFMLDITKTNLKKDDRISILNSANPLSLYANYSSTSEYEVMCKFGNLRADRLVEN